MHGQWRASGDRPQSCTLNPEQPAARTPHRQGGLRRSLSLRCLCCALIDVLHQGANTRHAILTGKVGLCMRGRGGLPACRLCAVHALMWFRVCWRHQGSSGVWEADELHVPLFQVGGKGQGLARKIKEQMFGRGVASQS